MLQPSQSATRNEDQGSQWEDVSHTVTLSSNLIGIISSSSSSPSPFRPKVMTFPCSTSLRAFFSTVDSVPLWATNPQTSTALFPIPSARQDRHVLAAGRSANTCTKASSKATERTGQASSAGAGSSTGKRRSQFTKVTQVQCAEEDERGRRHRILHVRHDGLEKGE